MKKVLLIGFILFCIFQLIAMSAEITIGKPAVNGNTTQNSRTLVNVGGTATGTGTITTVEIWANTDLTNVEVATFSAVGNVLTTRDWEAIPGTITAGSKVTKTVDLDVEIGDHIGIKFTGTIEVTGTTGSGTWNSGFGADKIPCTDEDFGSPWGATDASLYGIGSTPLVGITWNTVIITKWNNITISKWNNM